MRHIVYYNNCHKSYAIILKVNFQKGVSDVPDEIVYKKIIRKASFVSSSKVIVMSR